MKTSFAFAVAAAICPSGAVAHYVPTLSSYLELDANQPSISIDTLPNLIVSNEVTPDRKYVRRTNSWTTRCPVRSAPALSLSNPR
ncbi:hypothetical protein M422DRAFT_34174 [Sphaerobolus stellatus SS14]|uniref:Uncharacterized protein n=1 Tax=Sphaerobolus stellatus (strain SS14) TaxID=990650 RepID=A0A0C9UP91_SPHS4|nr:hypothetical protein M422DRAFT_38261 [Sphaerobolus stellatus SS14]KIJ36609.1 hypothetical protein M422DRAFT_34174 [Sphaerobolus stellatus SS14]